MVLLTLILMIGMSFGYVSLGNPISMKDLTNTKKWIIFPIRLKSLEKTNYASIFWKCKRDLERSIFISPLIHLYYQMKKKSSENFSKNYNELKGESLYGLLNLMPAHKEKEFISSMIWMSFDQQSNKLFLNTSRIHFWLMDTNLTWEFTCS